MSIDVFVVVVINYIFTLMPDVEREIILYCFDASLCLCRWFYVLLERISKILSLKNISLTVAGA